MMQETFWNQMCSTLPHTYVYKLPRSFSVCQDKNLWSKISHTHTIFRIRVGSLSTHLGPTLCATPILVMCFVMRQFPLRSGVLLMIAIR